jgi:hypothetical protein
VINQQSETNFLLQTHRPRKDVELSPPQSGLERYSSNSLTCLHSFLCLPL